MPYISLRETNTCLCECILSWASGKLAWASEILYRTHNRHLFLGECSRNLVSHTVYALVNWMHIVSGNVLLPGGHQAITWTNADLLLIGP